MKIFNFIDIRFKRRHTESNHKKFIIPMDNLAREEAIVKLKEIIKSYNEIIVFDIKDESNEMIVNGDIKIPFKKEYWIPVNSNKK
jgi:hypothetical protein